MAEEKRKSQSKIHEGHRARLLESIVSSGLENLSEVQQLEYMLSLALPRKDTNPIAHALLDSFGTIANVLDANPNVVAKTKNVGIRTANILSSLNAIHKCYQKSRLTKKTRITSNETLNNFCKDFLTTKAKEELFLFCLDSKQQLVNIECIQKGTTNTVKFDLKDINEAIVRSNACSVFLAHSHPSMVASPSNADLQSTKKVMEFLSMLGIPLIDHVIVAGENVFSFFQNQLLQKIKNDIFERSSLLAVSAPKESEIVWNN
ncbi:MAG: JAB domain-containing protein [Clostridia bacterium]